MKITVVGALAIAAVVLLLALLARFHRTHSPEDGDNSLK